MWYEWLIFAVVFLLITIAVANFKMMAEKRINLTEEQKKNANLFCRFLMLFYWLCDLFYMAFILDSLALKFIFGGLIMLIIFYNLSKAFISGASQFKLGLIQDFVVGVGMSIYLIYIIPCDDLKEVVVPVVSAVYGGLITLVGVAWTIRKADSDRKEEEKKKAEPLFSFNLLFNDKLPETRLICAAFEADKTQNSYSNIAYIINSDNSNFYLDSILYKDVWYDIENSNCVLKNHDLYFVFYTTEIGEDNLKMHVKLKDVLGNYHYYQFSYAIRDNKKGEPYTSMYSMKKVTKEEANG